MITDKDTIELLNKVCREGVEKTRYDKLDFFDVPYYDETDSVFTYIYTTEFYGVKCTYKYVIFMKNGQYVDYYRKEI